MCYAVSDGAVQNESTVSGIEGQSKCMLVSWCEWQQKRQWMRAVGSIQFIYWSMIWLWPERSCARMVLVVHGSVCSAVTMSGGRPLSSLDELLSMAVLTASCWMLLIAVMELVLLSGISARYCWMLDLYQPIRDHRRSGRSSGGLWQRW